MRINSNRIALLSGDGRLPVILAHRLEKNNLLSLLIVLQGNTERFSGLQEMTIEIPPGRVKEIIKSLKKNRIDKVIMIGKIDKQGFLERKGFDLKAMRMMKRIKDWKDTTIFHLILNEFTKIGIDVLPQDLYLKDLLVDKRTLTKKKPSKREMGDIIFGMDHAKVFSTMDVGQAVVVKNRVILAIEAIEGSNETIKRGGRLGVNRCTVCKAARKNQDSRFDIPAVGTETLKIMSQYGSSILALESGKIFLIDKEEAVGFADRKKISIIGI